MSNTKKLYEGSTYDSGVRASRNIKGRKSLNHYMLEKETENVSISAKKQKSLNK